LRSIALVNRESEALKNRLTSWRYFGRASLLFALLPVAAFTACKHDRGKNQDNRKSVSGPAAAVETTIYHGVGVVKSLNPKRPSIEIDHEDIKGLMPAMTMEFYVKDKSLLDGLKRGDRIELTLENGVGGLKITEIRKT
jgi:Cu(I)/Ag(I) efflux system protein CusF